MFSNNTTNICQWCGKSYTPTWRIQASSKLMYCSAICRNKAAHQKAKQRTSQRIEAQFGMSMGEALNHMYHVKMMPIRAICKLIGSQPASVLHWMNELGIARRDRSSAIALQWEGNPERRKTAADTLEQQRLNRPKEGPFIFTCEQCGATIKSPSRRIVRYCSIECQHKASKTSIERLCAHCKKPFFVKPSKASRRYHCSRYCFLRSGTETYIEKVVRECLERLGVSFIQEYKISRYHIDFYIPSTKLAIEVDGDYWHSINPEKDARKDAFLSSQGIFVIRITESELNSADPMDVVYLRIASYLA